MNFWFSNACSCFKLIEYYHDSSHYDIELNYHVRKQNYSLPV